MVRDYKRWMPLKRGDIVDIVAPGSGCNETETRAAATFLESWGLKPRVPEDIFHQHPLCSNNDDYRFNHLKQALQASDSKALWCLRGGYGSARLLPRLERISTPQIPKLVIGFSDITALHIFLHQEWGWASLHGPVLFQLGMNQIDNSSVEQIKGLIFGREEKAIFHNLEPLNAAASHENAIYSSVAGGTLSIVQTSIGTNWQMSGKGKIIFLEEVNERGYSTDRMLNHLSQAGILHTAKAVVFGDFIRGEEPDGISLNEVVIQQFAESMEIPVLRCKGIGHGQVNHGLPLGTQAILKLGASPTLSCDTGFAV